jgi:hypothetical protein
MKEPPPIRAMSRKEICGLLGFERHTFDRALKEKGIALPSYKLLTPQWQKIIFSAFWYPPGLSEKDYEQFG